MSLSNLPPLTWLRAFEASARHLSFTRAAAELNLTQSAISQHVRSLETFLGRELFTRKTRAIELNESGANYLPTVRGAFELLSAGTRTFTGNPESHLILQCNMAFSVFWLAPRLHRLYAAHPSLVLNIITPIWDPERHAGKATVEIRFGQKYDMSSDAMRLSNDRYFPVCRPDYQGGSIDFNHARLFNCAGVTSTWDAWSKSHDLDLTHRQDVNIGSTYVISLNAARHGAGIAMAHDTLAADLIQKGELIYASDHKPLQNENYYLLAPPEYDRGPATVAFVDWLKQELTFDGHEPIAN